MATRMTRVGVTSESDGEGKVRAPCETVVKPIEVDGVMERREQKNNSKGERLGI